MPDEDDKDVVALPNEAIMSIFETVIEKFCEFMARDIKADIARFDNLNEWEKLEVRAFWRKYIDTYLAFSKRMDEYKEPKAAFMLAVEQFGSQLGWSSSDLKPDIERRLEWYKARIAKDFERKIKQDIELRGVSSPIEQIFLMQWRFLDNERKHGLRLVPQKKVETPKATYKIDFYVTDADETVKLAVELDGHDFHEKTKEQAAKDKRRQREITIEGYTVLRYSGFEIVNNPSKCIDEIIEFAENLIDG